MTDVVSFINYHWPGPSALECKFVSLIKGRNDDQVGTIRRSSIVPERREGHFQVSLLREFALIRLISVLAVAGTN